MELNIMAPLAAPALGHIGTTVRSAAAQMRKALALLLVGLALALTIAGLTANSADAATRYGSINADIEDCFITGGDPWVWGFSGAYLLHCDYGDSDSYWQFHD